jgi:hypothetical protein
LANGSNDSPTPHGEDYFLRAANRATPPSNSIDPIDSKFEVRWNDAEKAKTKWAGAANKRSSSPGRSPAARSQHDALYGGGALYGASPTLSLSGASSPRQERREAKLAEVFRLFDLDGSGEIESQELWVLATKRRELGQKTGTWTEEKHRRLIDDLDTNGDGRVQENEFVEAFERRLPRERAAFDAVIEEFTLAAKSLQPSQNGAVRTPDSVKTTTKERVDAAKRWLEKSTVAWPAEAVSLRPFAHVRYGSVSSL